ncbi:MAG TPA: chorismate mutase [Gaiellaceae bacterium]|nr:chorismate mutase [Gaiellaceae bacterium]
MAPGDPDQDPLVRELRAAITAADRTILAAVNTRLELVRRLREHKRANGWDFVDPRREGELLDALARENPGPLSEEGVRELFGELLGLAKRETGDPAG